MSSLLMEIDLHLLIHTAPLGLESGDEAVVIDLEALAARGLLRPTATGRYLLTSWGRQALAACLPPRSERDGAAEGPS